MNCREVKYYLDDFAEGHLIDEMRVEIENHISSCQKCQGEFIDRYLIVSEVRSDSNTINPSKEFVKGIKDKISGDKEKKKMFSRLFSFFSNDDEILNFDSVKARSDKAEKNKARLVFIGGTTATILLGVLLGIILFYQSSDGFIQVERLTGSPKINSEVITEQAKLETGKWIETDAVSSVKLFPGSIGEIEVYPGSKVQLVKTSPAEQRLMLRYGKIDATIWAPPRLFFIETPSATVVDLGCMYTLEVDKDGSSLLTVKSGWVSFERNGIESFIPAGAVCKSKKLTGPGTPYFTDAEDKFINALYDYDFSTQAFGTSYSDNVKSRALSIIHSLARKKDSLSLWHILSTANGEDKAKTYFRLSELVQIPDNVTFEGIMNGDTEMINVWWNSLGFDSKSLWESM